MDRDTVGNGKMLSLAVHAAEEIMSAQTGYDIFKSLKAFIRPFDLSYFAVFMSMPEGATTLADRAVLTNWESEAIQRGMEEDFFFWAFTSGLRKSVLPQTASISAYLVTADEPHNRRIAEFMLEAGHDVVCHFELRSSNGHSGSIAFGGLRDLVAPEELVCLNFVAQHAFERLMLILDDKATRGNPLNDREVDCLRLTASGLNAAEAAEILGITSHTVNYHLASVLKKLDARNKTQAAVTAIQNGWLGKFR